MRSFAIIPAAGHSRRMGRHKLLMPFGDSTVLSRVLASWRNSPVNEVVVVARRDDVGVRETCEQAGVHTVTPLEDPPDMKVSIQHGLSFVRERWTPSSRDVWLLAPADLPRLPSAVIVSLLAAWEPQQSAILVPTYDGRRGHPILIPWPLAGEVDKLSADQGVNVLLARHATREVCCDDETVLDDLDTPDDYRRLSAT